jgi:hypothetical protein
MRAHDAYKSTFCTPVLLAIKTAVGYTHRTSFCRPVPQPDYKSNKFPDKTTSQGTLQPTYKATHPATIQTAVPQTHSAAHWQTIATAQLSANGNTK